MEVEGREGMVKYQESRGVRWEDGREEVEEAVGEDG